MDDIRECKECISYAMCRTDILGRLSESIMSQNKNFSITSAYLTMVLARCDIQQSAIMQTASYFKDRGYSIRETNDKVSNLILDIFDIDYDKYLQHRIKENHE